VTDNHKLFIIHCTLLIKKVYLCTTMKQGQRETLTIRIISTTFVVMALAVFKPFGLDVWQWQAYAHLVAIWVLGIGVCLLTDIIMEYIFRKPRSYERGVSYIIQRNLWFQLINTPLISLMICLYRHLVLSDRVASNHLSWSNYFETLVIIAFCSFAIGLYWRFKFRSRFLAAELEETRLLNEQLRSLTPAPSPIGERSSQIVLSGTTSEKITLIIDDLLFIEAIGNYVKINYLSDGQVRSDMLRATSKQMEDALKAYPMIVRCHRAFLVNLQQVEQIVSHAGSMQLHIKHCHDSLPVSRSNMAQIKEAIKGESLAPTFGHIRN